MLQIKNTLGGGKPEGLYVWKKSEVAWKHYEGDALKTKFVLAENVDEFKVYKGTSITENEDKTLTLEGKQAISVSTNYYTLASDTTHKYMVNGSDYFAFANSNAAFPAKVRYDTTTKTVTLEPYNSSYGYRLWGNQMQAGNLIGYVVSDKETAYPDGGEKGGYYYERVSDGITPEMFGATKKEEQTFTVSSSVSEKTITHSLGERPKLVLCFPSEDTCSESVGPYGTLMLAMMRMFQGSNFTSNPANGVYAGIYSPPSPLNGKGKFSGDLIDDMLPSISQVKLYTSGKFISGNTYKVILLA